IVFPGALCPASSRFLHTVSVQYSSSGGFCRNEETIMAVYAYLRVSTDQQDVDNQRYGLLAYANVHSLGPLQFVEDTASGRLGWRARAVGHLLTVTVQAGDIVLFTEISRMARSTLQVLEMLEGCMSQQVSVHIAKQQMVLDGSL